MTEAIINTTYFGVIITLGTYFIGLWVQKKIKFAIFNPLLISTLLTIAILSLLKIDYDTYNISNKYLSYFLTPVTVCLAVPLYEQLNLLKKNAAAVIISIICGVLTSAVSIFALSLIFGLTHEQYVTLLPKSITTAIGLGLSDELGGIQAITMAAITFTGIFGNVFSQSILKFFRIKNPIAVGLAIGTSSHALGTAKATEIGDIEGAMSGLSIAVAGLITVVVASVFAMLI